MKITELLNSKVISSDLAFEVEYLVTAVSELRKFIASEQYYDAIFQLLGICEALGLDDREFRGTADWKSYYSIKDTKQLWAV